MRQSMLEILKLKSFSKVKDLKRIIGKNFSSLKIIDLRNVDVKCSNPNEKGTCVLRELADFASPENIKKIWKNHSQALEEVLVARKDVSIPYEIIKLMEWFTFGVLRERVVEDSMVSEKMCVRYPSEENQRDIGLGFPVSVLMTYYRCVHVRNTCPWLIFCDRVF